MFTSSSVKESSLNDKDRVETAGNDMKEGVKRTKRDAYETANQVKHDVHGIMHDAGRQVRDFVDSVGPKVSHATDAVTGEIRGNPVRSSVVALGVGLVLGAFFSMFRSR